MVIPFENPTILHDDSGTGIVMCEVNGDTYYRAASGSISTTFFHKILDLDIQTCTRYKGQVRFAVVSVTEASYNIYPMFDRVKNNYEPKGFELGLEKYALITGNNSIAVFAMNQMIKLVKPRLPVKVCIDFDDAVEWIRS